MSADDGRASGGFRAWLNKRLPVDQFMADQLTGYYAPKNFNIWYFFGSLALLVFVMQIVTGIFITMHFKAGEATRLQLGRVHACAKCRTAGCCSHMHAVGASFFFIVVYLHMARAFLYGSYKAPARAAVGHRHAHLPRAHGRGVHGLRAALRQHVVLGRAGDHQPVRHHSRASARTWWNGFAATTASAMPR